MSSVSGLGSGSTDYSSLFSSLNTSESSGSGSSLLTDWASLKNGSYQKLAKAYYSKNSDTSVDSDEAKETIKSNSMLKSNVTDVKSSVSALSAASLYEKKEKKDADGNTTMDYDYDKIVAALKKYVESYNSTIDKADDSDNAGVLRNAAAMTRATASNQNMLSSIGITVGEDNKLELDEEEVKKADITAIKSLFVGGGSYGSQIENSATELINKLNAENNKLSSYTANGSYSTAGAVGGLYDGTY